MYLHLGGTRKCKPAWVASSAVKSIHTREYDALVEVVKRARIRAGVGQEALSAKLGESPMWVYKTETKGRRLDIVEFRALALALGVQPSDLFAEWLSEVGDARS